MIRGLVEDRSLLKKGIKEIRCEWSDCYYNKDGYCTKRNISIGTMHDVNFPVCVSYSPK